MKVREVAKTEKIRSISSMASLEEAMLDIEQHQLHHLLVVDQGEVMGLVSDRDILRTHLNYGPNPAVARGVKVKDIMTKMEAISEETELGEILRIMVERGVSAVPIRKSDQDVYIISQADLIILLERFLRTDQSHADYLRYGLSNPLFQSIMKIVSDVGI